MKRQEILGAIVESAQDAILSLTLDGIITSANGGAQHLYGYAPEELVGQHLRMLVPPDRWGEDMVLVRSVADGETIEHFDTQRRHKNGSTVDVSVTISRVLDQGGKIVALSSIAREIGERKQQAERYERLERLRSEFVSKVSHELRNPLAAIRGFAHLMTDPKKDLTADERSRFSEAIVRQVDHLAKLVDDISQVSHMEAGGFSYASIHFDPVRVVEESVAEARVAYPSHTIELDVASPLPEMRGDPERLGQVFANLIANACRYSPDRSKVLVRAQSGEGNLVVEVVDEGIGISVEEFPLLFKRFSRIPKSAVTALKGTGLGLYISKGIVEAHDGTIEVESEPDRGSTFRVILPVT